MAGETFQRCGGFRVEFSGGAPSVVFVPGERKLPSGVADAVLGGLSQAPLLLASALHVAPPPRPYDRVEVSLLPGGSTQGEAVALGVGCIRLTLGEDTSLEEAGRIARHEALHLLLASSLRGGARWNDPELAFADWIVRGIESAQDPHVPRFHAPFPALIEKVPSSRREVQRQLGAVSASPAAAERYFGPALFTELQAVQGPDAAAREQRQLWLVEAALGTHYLESASRLRMEESDGLRAIVLDDWLIDYEQYSRAVANPPSGPGNLWRLSEGAWSRDPLTRLSVAAQALQCHDGSWFAGDRFSHADEPIIWKNRGRVRLPLLAAPLRPRPAPVHGFRVVLRELSAPKAVHAVEEAASGAEGFEARALWPRILARMLAGSPAVPVLEPESVPVVQLIGSREAFQLWSAAAEVLRSLCGDLRAWVPGVAEPSHLPTLAEAPRPDAALLLVFDTPLNATALLASRRLAARMPVRGALFTALDGGRAHELLPDVEEPLDPRYREEAWTPGALPASLAELVEQADAATRDGRLTTPISYLLSMMSVGLTECHYPRAQHT